MSNVVNLPVTPKPAKTLRTTPDWVAVAVRLTASEAEAVDRAAATLGVERGDMVGRMFRSGLLFFKPLEEEGL